MQELNSKSQNKKTVLSRQQLRHGTLHLAANGYILDALNARILKQCGHGATIHNNAYGASQHWRNR